MQSSPSLPSVRATYVALRRAYRIASASSSLVGNVDAFRLCSHLLTAGRALTGNWQPFERLACRGDHWTEARHVNAPDGRFVCYRWNVWGACTRYLKANP